MESKPHIPEALGLGPTMKWHLSAELADLSGFVPRCSAPQPVLVEVTEPDRENKPQWALGLQGVPHVSRFLWSALKGSALILLLWLRGKSQ